MTYSSSKKALITQAQFTDKKQHERMDKAKKEISEEETDHRKERLGSDGKIMDLPYFVVINTQ